MSAPLAAAPARRGIILAGGSGSRLFPLTLPFSKQLMPVYDKPMIYYPLSVLMLAGIREILVITTPHDRPLFERLLGDGSSYGIALSYATQDEPRGLADAYRIGADFVGTNPSCLILGDNLFYGAYLTDMLVNVSARTAGATIFGYHVVDPRSYGVVEIDGTGTKALSLEEKPEKPRSNLAIPGLYFYDGNAPAYAREITPSPRGEIEITDLNRRYLAEGTLHVEVLSRGTAWLDTGTHENLIEAADYIRAVQNRQGLKVACLEEIGLFRGWIDRETIAKNAKAYGKSSYGEYLRMIAAEGVR
ncbi:Glucose-1-phosphate thymidylyltransferase [Verrucomicrobium sp. GAS474]|uniref:glucose-1-phosphate thymidylyltransferase RfbA n=1 Tax=Verrucomicrobium sp. GAS474 TaxID=1882831 RepID=UPI00087B64ED|nr:glucose-1-phosphate thymidylyltransferase RfbA [Verrucomicrobium sp. GAS474]SDT88174.1 Glucose-1-phosphate thymidylyltransferase [Verrucomicrobium sp. GAS474]